MGKQCGLQKAKWAERSLQTQERKKTILQTPYLWKKLKKELDYAYDKEEKNYVKSKIEEIKDAHINHHSRLVWDTVKYTIKCCSIEYVQF